MTSHLTALVKASQRGPVVTGPIRASWRHKLTFFGKLAMERWLLFGRSVPSDLKTLASLRAATMVGCVW